VLHEEKQLNQEMSIQTIEIVSEALCCIIFFVKVACSACRVEKCDDLERNSKKSLYNIRAFMLNKDISEMAIPMPIDRINH